MRVVDLTGPMHEGLIVYHGMSDWMDQPDRRSFWPWHLISKYKTEELCSFQREGFILHSIQMDSQSGTHLGAPAMVPIDELPVEKIVREGVKARILKGSQEEISATELEKAMEKSGYQEGDIVLIHTGHGDTPDIWYKREYVINSPSISMDAAKLLVDKKASAVGMDTPQLCKWDSVGWEQYGVLAVGGTTVIDGLINMKNIQKDRFIVAALPLKCKGLAQCPGRVVIIET